jgi:uncharacterized protein YdiU (UPF0061 family)
LTFRALCSAAASTEADARVRTEFADPAAYTQWALDWRARLAFEADEPGVRAAAMSRVSPAFIPRNHRVEQVIAAAVERQDFSLFSRLLEVLSRPYTDSEAFADYASAPRPDERVTETFCGT